MRKIISLLAIATFIFASIFNAIASATSSSTPTTSPPHVIISEVKLGGDSYSQGTGQPKDPQEFITLYNQSSSVVDLSNWTLEYAKPSFDKTHCSEANWTTYSVNGSVGQTELSGSLQPGEVSMPIERSLTDNSAGSLHLTNSSDPPNLAVEDLVGWGTDAPCAKTAPAQTPSSGKSIKRYLDCSSLPINIGDNSKDFASNQPPSPGAMDYPYLTNCQDNTATDTSDNNMQTLQPTCEGIVISELLPNPVGADSGNEFIELYNPTNAAISLHGCSLQTTANSKLYNFSDVTLQPGEYDAFYDSETGLTLSNSAAGTAWLLSPTTELQSITYPGGLDDNQAWVLVNSIWQASYQPTPNAANILVALKPCAAGEIRNSFTGYCDSVATLTISTLTVCPAGQYKNPATNRCKSIVSSSSSLGPCQPNQERNPTTNRCRSTTSSSSNLAPCKPGQTRNPATDRCKTTATTATAQLKPCALGQERNPATNRCRKVTSTALGTLSDIKDSQAAPTNSTLGPTWWVAGLAISGAGGYGIYEWRQEILQFIAKYKPRVKALQDQAFFIPLFQRKRVG